jgi:hypothetical protein
MPPAASAAPASAQRPEQPSLAAPALPKIDDNTVILTPDDTEGEVALHWLSERYPDIFPVSDQADEILRVELDTQELTKKTQVYVLARKRKGRKPLSDPRAWEQSPDGQRVTVHTPLEILAKEAELYGPVNCSEFFYSTGEKWQAPRLNQSAFLNALSAIASPWVVASPYVTEYKNGQIPTRYRLRNC